MAEVELIDHYGRAEITHRHVAVPAISIALLLAVTGEPVSAQGLYFECPCSFSSDGETYTVTAGFRSYAQYDSNRLRIRVYDLSSDELPVVEGHALLAQRLRTESTIPTQTYEIEFARDPRSLQGEYEIALELSTYSATVDGEGQVIEEFWDPQDRLRMDGLVDLSRSFSIQQRDYLTDTDGDGVADLNERTVGTDARDPASVPGRSIIDVVAFFSPGFASQYGHDPTTRIQHLFAVANSILQDSRVGIDLRLVGLVSNPFTDHVDVSIETAARERVRHGADLVTMFRERRTTDAFCGWASVGGWLAHGYMAASWLDGARATVVGDCSARTLTHEIGHLLGLGHADWQDDIGAAWPWARGHAVEDEFHTVMSYPRGGKEVLLFSDPDRRCDGYFTPSLPCGVDRRERDGADARTSLEAVRFQAAAYATGYPDTDGDGFVDPVDAYPGDANDWWDTDGDGIGDNRDDDDDGDGVADLLDHFPHDPTEWTDTDGDLVGDNADDDDDDDGLADAVDLLPVDPRRETLAVPLFPMATDSGGEGFVRVVNYSARDGGVRVGAADPDGNPRVPVTLAIGARQTRHFNATDLQTGNPAKGLSGRVGAGDGLWRLEVASDLDVDVLTYFRTPAGFLTALHGTVPKEGVGHRVVLLNPGSNRNQQSLLRLVNASAEAATVAVRGIDDKGESPGRELQIEVAAGAAMTIPSSELETGSSRFRGALGDGSGKWRLEVRSDRPIAVISLLDSPTGELTNLSAVTRSTRLAHTVPLFPSASDATKREGFARVVNHSADTGRVHITAYDDDGNEYGPVALALAAGAVAHFNSEDLESGNGDKGLPLGIGPGKGSWRLELSSPLDVEVLSYIRTPDGFVTAMHDLLPSVDNRRVAAIFNPAANVKQVSHLRLANRGLAAADVTIRGTDDDGSPGDDVVKLSIPARGARTIAAPELERGGSGLAGALGDGVGKWRLSVTSTEPILAMSLLKSPKGHLTNLSSTGRSDAFSDPLAGGGRGPEMVFIDAGEFRMGCTPQDDEYCGPWEQPAHTVVFARPFAMSKYEVTFAQWRRCLSDGSCDEHAPDGEGSGRDHHPVVNVSWNDALKYVSWLSTATAKAYRLPSEAEWEYAARAGSTSRYSWGHDWLTKRANCSVHLCEDRFDSAAPVGSFPANAWGLHDMHGNVSEVVQDCFRPDYLDAPLDGSARATGDCSVRVSRDAGFWESDARGLRVSARSSFGTDTRRPTAGFRVVRTVSP